MARRGGLAALVVVLVLCAPGCVANLNEVMVVGHDANGNPVAGAVDCDVDGHVPAEVLAVSDATGGQEVWRVERPGPGRADPPTGTPAPPAPDPRFVGGIEMVALGDPRPPGGEAVVALDELLPEEVVVRASTFADDSEPIGEVRLHRSGRPDSYEVAARNGTRSQSGTGGLDAAGAARLVEEECREDLSDGDVGKLLVGLGLVGGLLLLAAIPIVVITVRQYRRAGRAEGV